MPDIAPTASGLEEVLRVAQALERGDFRQRVTPRPPGVAGNIADALNAHGEMLETFRSECVRILDEMGVIGRLGGQAEVPDLRGSWHGLIASLNHMACAITEQVRNVSSVAERAARGDHGCRVTANACQGEYALLGERVNALVDRLRETAGEGAPKPV